MKRKRRLVLMVVGLLFIIGATASAQSSIELMGAPGAYRAAAREGAQVDSETLSWDYTCTAVNVDYGYPYPLTLLVYLYVDGNLQDSAYMQGTFEVEATVSAYFLATTYNQNVECYAYTTLGDMYAQDEAPGLPESEDSEFYSWAYEP